VHASVQLANAPHSTLTERLTHAASVCTRQVTLILRSPLSEQSMCLPQEILTTTNSSASHKKQAETTCSVPTKLQIELTLGRSQLAEHSEMQQLVLQTPGANGTARSLRAKLLQQIQQQLGRNATRRPLPSRPVQRRRPSQARLGRNVQSSASERHGELTTRTELVAPRLSQKTNLPVVLLLTASSTM